MYKNSISKNITALTVLVLLSKASFACSVCGVSFTEDEISSYLFVTALMILVPVVGLITLYYNIYKKYVKPKD